MTPRRYRIAKALLTGKLWREDVDRIAGASNGPEEISKLRGELGGGMAAIPCQRMKRTDRDGKACRPGLYSVAPDYRAKLAALVALHEGGAVNG